MSITPTPRTLELSLQGTYFNLRDERGSFVAKACGDTDTDEENVAEIARRYNRHEQLERELQQATAHATAMDTARLVADSELCQMRADLARVTAERDEAAKASSNWKWNHDFVCKQRDELTSALNQSTDDHATLRARVAELERDAEFQKQYAEAGDVKLAQERAINVQLETERNAAKELARHRIEVHELMTVQRNEARAERDGCRTRAGQAKQRNVELVAALREATTELRRLEAECIDEELGRLHSPQLIEAEDAIARAESATPAVVQESLTTESATPGLRTDNPMAEPVMGGLPRYDGEKLGTPAKHPDTELLEWLFGNTIIAGHDGHVIDCRDDANAARKHGGSEE